MPVNLFADETLEPALKIEPTPSLNLAPLAWISAARLASTPPRETELVEQRAPAFSFSDERACAPATSALDAHQTNQPHQIMPTAPTEGALMCTLPYQFDQHGQNVIKQLERKPSRRDKGLKILSVAVRDYVIKKQSTTYAEVSEELKDIQGQQELKDQKNVKRRVYDALNVLVAAGVLHKEEKKVFYRGVPDQTVYGEKLQIKSEETATASGRA